MNRSLDQLAHDVLGGRDRSLAGRALRAAAALGEPPYAGLMTTRNALYDRGWLRSHALGRPTISVGNLTAGGTGKTPVVRWLAEAMRQRGHHPAILLRGYMRQGDAGSDEAAMLGLLLNQPGRTPVQIEPNPDRVAGARAVLARHPETDRFVLDDGFQHRRAKRDFNLVLIDAAEPFGFNHVHPRGLLREPISGLRRADAILLTRTDAADAAQLDAITHTIGQWNPDAPVFRSIHQHTGLVDEDQTEPIPIDLLSQHRFIAFAGIGHPAHLHHQLQKWGGNYVGGHWPADHHAYTQQDIQDLIHMAQDKKVQTLVTTAKDWIKLIPWRDLWRNHGLRVWRLDLAVRFQDDDGHRLLSRIEEAMN